MDQDIILIPLGGGQNVGASCYYLRAGGANIILDAGTGIKDGAEFGPNFHFLVTSPFMQSISQINQIFISHAHMDHVGYLLKLMKQTAHSDVYMTEITKYLAEYQLYDRLYIGNREKDEAARLAARSLLDRIATVGFMQSIDFGGYRVTFYPAGHIPGAMMMLFETGKRNILYTGDYSLHNTGLTQGCTLPEGLQVDTVILCGLHAKHPDYEKQSDSMFYQADALLEDVSESGRSVLCQIPQLSKGIEFLRQLNDRNVSGIPICLDDSMLRVVSKMEQLSVPILNVHNRPAGALMPVEPHIFLTLGGDARQTGGYQKIRVDFSLHDDFQEMKLFLKKINPGQAILLHCDKERSIFDSTIEQEMMRDGECRTQFIFAKEEEIYRI